MNMVITGVVLLFFVLGAIDYTLGNKFKLGQEFENAIMICGRLLLSMPGFMVLAPLIAQTVGDAVAPFFRAFGADPSIFAGLFLANDSGGAALAMELADSPDAGLFSGLIVGSMLGKTVMLSLPVIIFCAPKEDRQAAIYGIICGIITIPLGCLAGGFAAGFTAELVFVNTFPVLVISGLLLVLILTLREKVAAGFYVFGKVLTSISIFGLVCGVIENMTGYMVLPGMDTLDSVFPVVGGITVFLAGVFPFMAVVRRVFDAPLTKVGHKIGINNVSVSSLVLILANALPVIMRMHEMDEKGRMLNIAFLVSAGCVLGDHLAFTAQIAPEMCVPVMVGKLVGGVTAFGLALMIAPKLLRQKKPAT